MLDNKSHHKNTDFLKHLNLKLEMLKRVKHNGKHEQFPLHPFLSDNASIISETSTCAISMHTMHNIH